MKKILEFLKKAWSVVWNIGTLAHGGCCMAISLAFFVIFATPAFDFPIGLAVAAGLVLSMIAALAVEFVQSQLCDGWTKEEAVKDIIRGFLGSLVALIPQFIYILN